MKLAVSGKGGVGKTTFSSLLISALAARGQEVLAIDADPDANLAQALGFENADRIVPISQMRALIEERTEAKTGTYGSFFKLNPHVADLPEKLSAKRGNIRLMVMGGVEKGGGGCICPESTMLKALVAHLVLYEHQTVVLDMEAGIEHLGRGTARSVDKLIVVVEPGRRSIETAHHIKDLASDIGVRKIFLVGNKIRSEADKKFLEDNLTMFPFLCFLPYDDQVIQADLTGVSPFETSPKAREVIEGVVDEMLTEK